VRRAVAPLTGTPASTVASAVGYTAACIVLPLMVAIIALRRITGNPPRFDPLIRFGAACIPTIFGIRVRTRGTTKLDRGDGPPGPFIIVSNHVNIFDGFILRGYLPAGLPIRALELASHFSWPVYGTAMRLYGNIPIPHNSPREAMGSLVRARRALASGTSILILPEGHRTRTGRLQRFMSGPFRLAREARAPILPVVMTGMFERQRVGYPRIHPGTVTLHAGNPVTTDEVLGMSERELRDCVHARMRAMLRDHDDSPRVPVPHSIC
jgi:1-acyl-sn-glycerol-3-phosphate acyltransferase